MRTPFNSFDVSQADLTRGISSKIAKYCRIQSAGWLLCGVLTGCGGGKPAPPAPAQVDSPTQSNSSGTPATGRMAPATAPHSGSTPPSAMVSVDPNHKETKWIGTIPYDVFYDQPLNIATDTTAVAAPAATAIASTTGSPAAMSPSAATPEATSSASPAPTTGAASAVNWAEILPMAMLVEEVKLLRTNLTGNLQTVATFNKAQKPIALDGAMLTAMATLATVHPEEVSWKPNAHFVRDLAFEINANSEGSGREPYTKTKEPFDKALAILDGGKPPEMESPATVPFAESVYVADMMKQIELTFNSLKSNMNTEARLKENPAVAEREMRILMALATMMGDASYDTADQKAYQDFLKRFTDGTKAGVQAIQVGNLEGFQAALNQVQTTCAECHQQYRGSDSGF